ncbi:LamG-like jellyroll fold domain-containing protein [Haloferula sp.]|uniref:LamG-like jellyroll fold domain-containing protein n=1 Tax=Haloferula sp. TaxID=2497595 RepID=UPI0032A0AA2D
MSPADFESSVFRMLDGELPQEGLAELQGYMASSAEARKLYLEYVELHNVLDLELAIPAVVQPGTSDVVPVKRLVARQQRRIFRWSAVAAAALVVLTGVLFRLVLAPESESLLSFRVANDSILRVNHSTSGDEAPAPGTLAKGSRMVLDQGTVELTLRSGVVAIVEAPAELTLKEEDRLQLSLGEAWFEVPKGAEGFQVQTPDVLVTDLGTQFGVISTDSALDEVHVFKGKVRVENLHGLKESELLTGGEARLVGPAGRFNSIPVRSDEFLTTLPDSLPHVHLAFDSIEGDQLGVSGSHPDVPGITARLVGSSSSAFVTGQRGKALSLSGQGDFVHTDWSGISGGAPRSVACWIRTSGGGETAAIVGWGSIPKNGRWKIHLVEEGPGKGRIPQVTGGGFAYLAKGARVDDGQWHHIAVVYYGGMSKDGLPDLAIFVDGHLQNSSMGNRGRRPVPEVNTITDAPKSMPLLVGKTTTSQQGSFKGDIDELYIFEGALSNETIERLAAGQSLSED